MSENKEWRRREGKRRGKKGEVKSGGNKCTTIVAFEVRGRGGGGGRWRWRRGRGGENEEEDLRW